MKLYSEGKSYDVQFVSPSAKVRKLFSQVQKEDLEKKISINQKYEDLKEVPLDSSGFSRYMLEHPELKEKAYALLEAILDTNEEVLIKLFKVIVAKVPDQIKAEFNLDYDSDFWQSQDLSEMGDEITKFREKARF